MTPEAQRIAIAEACPATIKHLADLWFYMHQGVWTPCRNNDPLSDLNAMHEAEKVLTVTLPPMSWKESERTRYVNHLNDMCGSTGVIMATAARKVEAFLRALGKWKQD